MKNMTTIQSLISDLTSGNDDFAEFTVDQIVARGTEALPALFELLDSSNPNNRWWALRVLAVIHDPAVPPKLQEALHDPDHTIRQCAALGLSKQTSVAAIPDLIKILNDEDRLAARLAGDALISIGGPAVQPLIEILEGDDNSARIEAARALGIIGDTRAIPVLFAAWEDGSALLQHWIEQGFEKMGVGMQFFNPK
jgi:HEAT repeat protein